MFVHPILGVLSIVIDGGYATVHLRLPRVYYTPGEFLPITSQIENHSDITITKTTAKLIMDVVYHEVSGKTAKTSNTLLARNQGKIKGGNDAKFRSDKLHNCQILILMSQM